MTLSGSFLRAPLALAQLTLREALRQRFAAGLALVALLLAGSGLFLQGIDLGGAKARLLADLGFGALVLFGSALAIVVPAASFFADLEQRTVLTLLAKPVARWQYLTGKWLGVVGLLGGFTLLLTGVIAGQLAWASALPEAEHRLDGVGLLVAAGVTWLRLSLLSALTLAIAAYARSSLFTILAGGGAMVIGQLQYLARGAWERVENPLLAGLAWGIAHLFPNLQAFDLAEPLVFQEPPDLPFGTVARVLLYGTLYAAAYLGAAVVLFQRREL